MERVSKYRESYQNNIERNWQFDNYSYNITTLKHERMV